ncbi:MAG TPA: DUF882 domain-containing protein [Polyangiaceae bacterium]|nr:DUF882 domain-containing protein [Polyangiaceae bacterium]
MHRFTASLLAFLGALTLPPRDGHADPPAGGAAAKTERAVAPAKGEAAAKREAKGPAKTEGDDHSKKPARGATGKAAAGPKRAPAWTRGQPGVVKLVRGTETLEVRVLDRKQRLLPATLPQFARFLRAKSGADHPIDGRLVTLVAIVSDHFAGREVNVVSGFRPYSARQYSRHSNHNEGRAIDFSIKGIANEAVRDFCRTLRNVGVGYYPNSLFVHLDVRDGNAYWVDYAAPGQAPRYRPGDVKSDDDDDEGDAIASVEGGPSLTASPSGTPRADVAHGRHGGRGGDGDATGERGVFVNR